MPQERLGSVSEPPASYCVTEKSPATLWTDLWSGECQGVLITGHQRSRDRSLELAATSESSSVYGVAYHCRRRPSPLVRSPLSVDTELDDDESSGCESAATSSPDDLSLSPTDSIDSSWTATTSSSSLTRLHDGTVTGRRAGSHFGAASDALNNSKIYPTDSYASFAPHHVPASSSTTDPSYTQQAIMSPPGRSYSVSSASSEASTSSSTSSTSPIPRSTSVTPTSPPPTYSCFPPTLKAIVNKAPVKTMAAALSRRRADSLKWARFDGIPNIIELSIGQADLKRGST